MGKAGGTKVGNILRKVIGSNKVTTPTSTTSQTGQYQGPVKEGTSEAVYRATGTTGQLTPTVQYSSPAGPSSGGGSSSPSQENVYIPIEKVIENKKPISPTVSPTTKTISLSSNQLNQLSSINKKPSETYDPRIRQYVSTTQRSGTSTMRSPTLDERRKMDTPNYNSKFERRVFGENRQENILTADVSGVTRNIEQVNKLSTDLTSRSNELTNLEKVNEQGEWIGTDSELIDYNRKIDEYNSRLGRYNDLKNINVGVLGYTTQRDIREFDLKRKPITSTFKVISATAGSTAGGLTTDITGKEKLGKGVGKVVEFGYDVGKYAIPFLGTSIFAIETGESIRESGGVKQFVKEKPLEAGLLLGFGTLLIGKEIYQAGRSIKLPSKTTSVVEQKFMKKYTTENVPKIQKIEAEGFDLFPKLVKGGETTIIQEFNPTTKIVTTGKRFKDIQKIDAFGYIKGTSTKTSVIGKYGNELKVKYEYNPNINILKQDLYKNKKFIKSELIKNPEQLKQFGLTEMSKGNVMELKAKQVTPNKIRNIFSEKRTKYTQDYISLEEGLKVEGKQRIKVTDVRQTILQPATKKIKVGVKSTEGEVGIIKEVERKTAKLSKKGSNDLLKLNKPVVFEDMVGSSGEAIKSPRFSDILTREIKSRGKFEITRETPFNKVIEFEKRLLSNKKGQSLLQINKLDTRVNVPTPKVNLPEVNKFNMIFPEVSFGESSLGTLAFKEERILKYKPDVKVEDLGFSTRDSIMSNVKVFETEVQKPEVINKNILNTFTESRAREKVIDKVQPREENLFKEIQKEKVKERQIFEPKNLLKEQSKQKYELRDLLKQKPRQVNVERFKPRIPIKTKEGIMDFTAKEKPTKEDFELFGKRFGKFSSIGKAKTKGEAEEKIIGWLKSGLGRSAFVEAGGKKLKFEEFNLSGEFRPSKKSREIIVQRKEFALSKMPEVKEIQMFKSKRGNFL
jgi:hypothetical protein